jgi:superfamily II DNA helicase RecQ
MLSSGHSDAERFHISCDAFTGSLRRSDNVYESERCTKGSNRFNVDHVMQKSICARIMGDDCDFKAVYTTPETLKHNVRAIKALRFAAEEGRVNFATTNEAHWVLEWSGFR